MLLVLLFAWVVSVLPRPLATQNVTYDDLALIRCEYIPVSRQYEWSIHGLWPEYNQTTWPQFCNTSRYKEFTPQSIAAFRDLMNKYWSGCEPLSFAEDDTWQFWVHEWQKHGTCQPLPPSMYFRRTIDLFLEAQKANWYGCCDSSYGLTGDYRNQCLIHINKTTYQWTGKC